MNISSTLKNRLIRNLRTATPLLALMSVIALPSAHAAAVTWGTATTASSDTNVLNTGTILQALNFGDSGGPIAVNGVSFTDISSLSYGTTMGSGAGSVVLGDDSYMDNGGLSSYSGFGSSTAPFSSLSSNYQAILQSAAFRQTGTTSNLLFTITGLEIGENYRVQFWANDARSAGAGRETTYSAVNSVTLDQNSLDADGGPGQFVTGYFTADSTTQDILLTASLGPVSLVSAYTLAMVSAIPEPASLAFVFGFVALVGVALRRRHAAR